MPCSETQARIPTFLDGTLESGLAAALARHLVGCEVCRAALLSARVPQHGLPVSGPEDPGFWGPMDAVILAELDRVERAPGATGPTHWLSGRVPTRRVTLLAYGALLVGALAWGLTRSPADEAPEVFSAPEVGGGVQPAPREAEPAPALRPASYVPAHGSL